MAGEGSTDRITVSRETLRAELSQMELRLVDRLTLALEHKADAAVVSEMDKRLVQLELSKASREHIPAEVAVLGTRLDRIERWRYGMPSLAALAALAAILLTIHAYLP